MKLADVLQNKIEKAEEDIRAIDERLAKALGLMVELEDNVVEKQEELTRVESQIGQLSRQNMQLDERLQRLRLSVEAKGADRLAQAGDLRLESFPAVVDGRPIDDDAEDAVLTLDAVAEEDEAMEPSDLPPKRRKAVHSALKGLGRNL